MNTPIEHNHTHRYDPSPDFCRSYYLLHHLLTFNNKLGIPDEADETILDAYNELNDGGHVDPGHQVLIEDSEVPSAHAAITEIQTLLHKLLGESTSLRDTLRITRTADLLDAAARQL